MEIDFDLCISMLFYVALKPRYYLLPTTICGSNFCEFRSFNILWNLQLQKTTISCSDGITFDKEKIRFWENKKNCLP